MTANTRLWELSTWDDQLLGENLKILSELDLQFDLETIGFDYGEVEQRILAFEGEDATDDEADEVPDTRELPTVSRVGDLWRLGSPDAAEGEALDHGPLPSGVLRRITPRSILSQRGGPLTVSTRRTEGPCLR